jgi:hypothetical protein
MREPSERFPTAADGLPEARPLESIELAPGGRFDLRIAPVAKRLGDVTVRMLAYNGSIPGPTLRVRQGSELVVDVVNDGDLEATVHWHGLRLDNRYDGTPQTQAPIPVGGRFSYRLAFPDPGVYWYHPHIREDYTQEMGLYGMIVVVPSQPDYWPRADRELALALDDVLLEAGRIAPFDRTAPTTRAPHAEAGRGRARRAARGGGSAQAAGAQPVARDAGRQLPLHEPLVRGIEGELAARPVLPERDALAHRLGRCGSFRSARSARARSTSRASRRRSTAAT